MSELNIIKKNEGVLHLGVERAVLIKTAQRIEML